MNLKRFFRFNPISKLLFSNKKIDYFLRKYFMQKFFNEHYGNSSLNALDINKEILPILKKYNGMLGHGLALKLIRDKSLPTNQDLDYDIFDVSNIDNLIFDMEKLGYILYLRAQHNNKDKFLTFYKDGAYIDFFICEVINNKYEIHTICCESIFPKFKKNNEFYISKKFISYSRTMTYSEINTSIFNNNKFYLPQNYDLYFTEMYGNDWKQSKPYFNWALNPKNNLPKKIKKNNLVMISKKNYLLNYK